MLSPEQSQGLIYPVTVYVGERKSSVCYFFVQLGFTMKLTHLSPVQHLFIGTSTEAFIGGGTN
jgi:hypothetical protein